MLRLNVRQLRVALSLEYGHNHPPILLFILSFSHPCPLVPISISLPNFISLQTRLSGYVKESDELRSAGVKARYDPRPGMLVSREKVEYRFGKSKMLSIHPQTICAEDACEVIRMFPRELIAQNPPFVALNRNTAPTVMRDVSLNIGSQIGQYPLVWVIRQDRLFGTSQSACNPNDAGTFLFISLIS